MDTEGQLGILTRLRRMQDYTDAALQQRLRVMQNHGNSQQCLKAINRKVTGSNCLTGPD